MIFLYTLAQLPISERMQSVRQLKTCVSFLCELLFKDWFSLGIHAGVAHFAPKASVRKAPRLTVTHNLLTSSGARA